MRTQFAKTKENPVHNRESRDVLCQSGESLVSQNQQAAGVLNARFVKTRHDEAEECLAKETEDLHEGSA